MKIFKVAFKDTIFDYKKPYCECNGKLIYKKIHKFQYLQCKECSMKYICHLDKYGRFKKGDNISKGINSIGKTK